MSATQNKAIIRAIHDAMDKGNGQPFVDSLADDVRWTLKGTTGWSGTYIGKEAVQKDLLQPLFAQFQRPYLSKTERVIAEDDLVVVQFSGDVATRSRGRYANQYCYIYRLEGGKVVEITEYFDTALVDAALEAPARAG